jgi:cyanophycin synthetase
MNNNTKQAEEGDLQQELVLKAARDRGVNITDVSKQMLCKAAILELDGQVELLVRGIISSSMSMKTKYFCDFKQLTKNVFDRLEIPSPKSLLFFSLEEEGLDNFIQIGKKYVCKPQVAANGIGVEIDIRSFQQVKDYWERNKDIDNAFLLEEQIDGEDLRIQVIDGHIAASCIRVPAYVVGDGINTLAQLIEIRRKIIHEQCPSDSLKIDRTSFALIKEQGFDLEGIPEADKHIQLKIVSNIGQGGIAIDVSDKIHLKYKEWVHRIVEFCDASYFALDVICQDHTKDPKNNAFAIELNSLAEWTHHTFSERRTHDLGKIVIDTTFGL